MARVTVEDCVELVSSRFELVLLAGARARQISAGAPLTLDRDRDKDPVVALREIAEETVTQDDLREARIRSLQKHVEKDEPEDDDLSLEEASRELKAAEDEFTPENLQKVLTQMVSQEVEDTMDMTSAEAEQPAAPLEDDQD